MTHNHSNRSHSNEEEFPEESGSFHGSSGLLIRNLNLYPGSTSILSSLYTSNGFGISANTVCASLMMGRGLFILRVDLKNFRMIWGFMGSSRKFCLVLVFIFKPQGNKT